MITKGKWTFEKHSKSSQWFGNIIGHPNPNDPRAIRTILCLTRYCDTDAEQEANARLIAAAPKLLEACKYALIRTDCLCSAYCDDKTTGEYMHANEASKRLEKAIAECEGE